MLGMFLCNWDIYRTSKKMKNKSKQKWGVGGSRRRKQEQEVKSIESVLEILLQCSWDAIFFQTLRKHAYSNILKILPPKKENFQIKNSDIFHISAQNLDCGYSLEPPRRCGSNEYLQSVFLSRHKKNNVYPCKPQFYILTLRSVPI